MNIDEMKAGAELDALIAEKVLKWTPRIVKETSKQSTGQHTVYDGPNGECCIPGYYYRFSTSGDAWLVAEHVCEMLDVFYEVGCDDVDHYAMFIPRSKSVMDDWPYASASTRPLAICRASLKAMKA